MKSPYKQFLFCTSLLILTTMMTGCNVKFIEKAPEKEPVEDTSNLGEVEIDPNDTDHMELEEPDKDYEFSEEEEETPQPTEEVPPVNENQKEVDGILFDLDKKTVWIASNGTAFPSPKLTGTGSTTLTKGSEVSMLGVSQDKNVAMIKMPSGSIYYIEKKYISETKIDYDPEQTTPPDNSTTENLDSSNNESTPPENNNNDNNNNDSNNNSNNNQPTEQPRPTEPPKQQGGIPYPSNPATTSINMGVTFADENFTATVVNKTTMNSGPGKVLNSTGYTVIETFEAGTTVNCTGIGQNGYIRVVLADGTQGFILNTDLKR